MKDLLQRCRSTRPGRIAYARAVVVGGHPIHGFTRAVKSRELDVSRRPVDALSIRRFAQIADATS